MIKGFLKIMVLESLRDRSKTGYELMAFIEEKNGKKPSPGSIYPLLKELHQKGFVKVKNEDRKKIYSITVKGRKRIKEIEEERKILKQKHEQLHRIIDELSGKKSQRPLDFESEEIMRNMDVLHELKEAIKDVINGKEFYTKETEMRKIIKNASKRLKKLK